MAVHISVCMCVFLMSFFDFVSLIFCYILPTNSESRPTVSSRGINIPTQMNTRERTSSKRVACIPPNRWPERWSPTNHGPAKWWVLYNWGRFAFPVFFFLLCFPLLETIPFFWLVLLFLLILSISTFLRLKLIIFSYLFFTFSTLPSLSAKFEIFGFA